MHTVVLAAFWEVTTQRTCKVKKKGRVHYMRSKELGEGPQDKTILWHLASEYECLKKKKKTSLQLLICNICGNALSIQNSYPISLLLQVSQEHLLLILFYPFPMRGNPSIWTRDVLDCSCQLGKWASSTLLMQETVFKSGLTGAQLYKASASSNPEEVLITWFQKYHLHRLANNWTTKALQLQPLLLLLSTVYMMV